MPRIKKLTDYTYSPTNPASEDAIRLQIDDSIQEVYDASSRNDATVNLTGEQTVGGVKTFTDGIKVPFASSVDNPIRKDTFETHKTSSDHDGRYYTETEVNALLLANQQGNHEGLWQGRTPVESDPGIQAIVNDINKVLIKIEDYREDGMTDTQMINNAILLCPSYTELMFDSNKTYEVGEVDVIRKSIAFNFNGAKIKPITPNVCFTFGISGSGAGSRMQKIINFTCIYSEITPTSIIKIIESAPNVLIDGYFVGVKANHSLIHNFAGYGTKIRGDMVDSDCPRCVYLSEKLSVDGSFSYAIDFNADITNCTGKGIELEGGGGNFLGVIQSCIGGGIDWNGTGNLINANFNLYFENNSLFDLKLGSGVAPTGISNVGRAITVSSKFIFNATLNKILLGLSAEIVAMSCFYQYGGVSSVTGTSDVGNSKYIGINNTVSQSTTGWTNGYEINDTIKTSLAHNILKPFATPTVPTIIYSAGVTGTLTKVSETIIQKTLDEFFVSLSYTYVPSSTGNVNFSIANVTSGYQIKFVELHFGTLTNDGLFYPITRRGSLLATTITGAGKTHELFVKISLVKI